MSLGCALVCDLCNKVFQIPLGVLILACALGALDFSWKACLRLGFSQSLADLSNALGGVAP